MMTIAKINAAAYYLAEQSTEYYLGGEWPVRILGSAATALGFAGRTTRQGLTNLFAGLFPDGEKRFAQDQQYRNIHKGCGKVRQKTIGWDATFSVPKTVSVAWAIGPKDMRREIEASAHCAVEEAIRYLEENAAFTRRGHGGAHRERVKLIAAVITHATSRAGDMQYHLHTTILNAGLRQDGTTGTIVSKPLFLHQKSCGAVFRAELAKQIQQRLSLPLVRTKTGFEIDGIPAELCRHFSKRAREIEKRLSELGHYTAKDAARVTLETRRPKGREPPLSELLEYWRTEAQVFGVTPDTIQQLTHRPQERQPKPRFEPILNEAKETLTREHDVFEERDLVQHTLDASVASGLDVNFVQKATKERLRDRREFVPVTEQLRRLGLRVRDAIYMTTQTRNHLSDTERRIKRLSRDRSSAISNQLVEQTISHYSRPRTALGEEIKHHVSQIREAARGRHTQPVIRRVVKKQASMKLDSTGALMLRYLTRHSGRVAVIEDWPTEQRDLALKAAATAWRGAGYEVGGCAARHKHAELLEENASIPSMTYKRLERKSHPTLSLQMKWHGIGLVRTALKKRTAPLPRLRLDASTVLVVERADCLRPTEINRLVRDVEQNGGKLVLLTKPSYATPDGSNPVSLSLLQSLAAPTWQHAAEMRQRELELGKAQRDQERQQKPEL